jgi:FkbM family methyltransferase
MKKKYLLKGFSIFPHFIYKRIVSKYFSQKPPIIIDNNEGNKEPRYYGQLDPPLDKLIYEKYFNQKIVATGIAVECGAFDGKTESTCLFFEESLGWLVHNIEPVPSIYSKLLNNRKYSINHNIGLSEKGGTQKFNNAIHPNLKENSGNGSIKHKDYHMEKLIEIGCTFEEITIETLTISKFFLINQIKTVDLFILDVAGYEFEILSDLKNTEVRPSVLCVGKQHDNQWNDILALLENLGYKYTENLHNTGIFVLTKLLPELHNPIIDVTPNSKPKINIVSNLLQNSIYVTSFFAQLNSIHSGNYPISNVFLSLSGTELVDSKLENFINDSPFRVHIKFDPVFTINPFLMSERSQQWALVGNENIKNSLSSYSDFTLFVGADLTLPPDILDYLVEAQVDVAAPIVMLGKNFYDSWGFRKLDGEKIYNLKEFESESENNLIELSSVGSCLLVNTVYLRKNIREPSRYEDGLFVGLCNGIRNFNGKIFCRTDVAIIHPTSYWKNQLWTAKLTVLEEVNDSFVEISKHKLELPGIEDEFTKPYIKDLHKSEFHFCFLIKDTGVKTIEIFCFSNKESMEKYKLKHRTYDKKSHIVIFSNDEDGVGNSLSS